jgi:hypothetical protein
MAQLDNDGTGSEDVACAVAFGQSGPLWGLHGSGSDGDIEGPDELSYIDRAAVFAKVVVNIGWCSVYGPGIGGCTNVNARNSVVVAAWAVQGSARGEFYGHEFGHAVGLSHFNVGVNFMNQTFDPTFNRMLQFQCTGLMNTPIDFDGPGTYSGSQTLFAGTAADYSKTSIMDLARRVFTDGAPAEVEDFYGASDVAVLKQMLASPDQAPYQNTIVSLIGLLSDGSDADAHVLLDFADANSETSAAHSAIISLGYVAERGSRIALDGLKEKTRQTKSQLSKAAVAGLALSRNDEALDHLQKFASSSPKAAPRNQSGAAEVSAAGMAAADDGPRIGTDVINEAVKANRAIAMSGRRAYYGR